MQERKKKYKKERREEREIFFYIKIMLREANVALLVPLA
jgi:hypothetical protein